MPTRAGLRAAFLLLGGLIACSLPVAVLWWWLAPRAAWVIQGGGGYVADGETKAFIRADLLFVAFGIGVGAAVGALCYRLARRHGPVIAVAAFVGSLAGSGLAAVLGHWFTLGDFAVSQITAGDGKTIDYVLTLRAAAGIFAWPFAAELGLLLFTLTHWPREVAAIPVSLDYPWAPPPWPPHAEQVAGNPGEA